MIYVRGLHGCLSFKFSQFLSSEKPIIGQTIKNNRANLYVNRYFKDQFVSDDPKVLVKETVKLLNNTEKLRMLGESNAKVFDDHFTPEAIVRDIMNSMKQKILEENIEKVIIYN